MVNLLFRSEEGLGVLKTVPRKVGLFFGLCNHFSLRTYKLPSLSQNPCIHMFDYPQAGSGGFPEESGDCFGQKSLPTGGFPGGFWKVYGGCFGPKILLNQKCFGPNF